MATSKTEPRIVSKCLSTVLELLKCCTVEELDNLDVPFTLKTKSGDEQMMRLSLQKMADRTNLGMSRGMSKAYICVCWLESRSSNID